MSIGDIYDELRSHGSDAISLDCFTTLTELLDDFDSAFTDFANTFRKRPPRATPTVAALSPKLAPPDELALLRAEVASLEAAQLRAQVAAFKASPQTRSPTHAPKSATAAPKPKPPYAGRGRGASSAAQPASKAPATPQAKVPCTDPTCLIMHNCRWLACHCGAPSADLTVCLLCPAATNTFSIGTCNSCFTTFTPANSRPAHARHGNMSKFMPPSFNNAPHRVQALAIAPPPTLILDADDFLEYYSENTPSSTLALRGVN